MITINDIPKSWINTLFKIKEKYPNAIIAGGALRDLYLNKPYKDVDYFIPKTHEITVIFDNYNFCYTKDYKEFLNNDIETIYKYNSTIDMSAYDIVYVNNETIEDVINRFDFGFCRIAFDGYRFYFGEGFLEDVENKTITLLRCDNEKQYRRSVKRGKNFLKKYDDYKLVIGESYNG